MKSLAAPKVSTRLNETLSNTQSYHIISKKVSIPLNTTHQFNETLSDT